MGRYILGRVVSLVFVLLAVTLIAFLLMHAVPGGPFDITERRLPEATRQAQIYASLVPIRAWRKRGVIGRVAKIWAVSAMTACAASSTSARRSSNSPASNRRRTLKLSHCCQHCMGNPGKIATTSSRNR